ncbi:hypothetical protein CEUSTIGMA_g9561.t1 [Chlamydomonas eustigma]|uniref:histidinol-phosphatase n=1 Tax=Chlamydomonas eustigma TaxID=1157962 RepID=A0A250XGF2_9CHLO|nr:hypothetical protein CEUSTIGMA_g9561.t1 [Chlamydomonas eustigma]|eukprot:GAX82133.1 hypothetical protein CEUSTIGMA_g9561.t1 [Chlamydomonas eustigma]
MISSVSAHASLPSDFQESYIAIANQLADAAGLVTSRYFRSPFDVETKSDDSPVTIADRESEMAMRSLLSQVVPDHGVFGEEFGVQRGSGLYTWVIDPVDGTKSFITGKPLFGTLIALLHDGVPVLGIIDQPILKERWLGVTGRPSTLNGKPIRTRPCKDPKLAFLYATTPHMFSGTTEQSFNRVRDAVRIPMYGCDCYAYGLLAAGLCDLVVEADLKPYDYMALVPIIKGAGGAITDWQGQELVWRPSDEDPSKEAQAKGWPGEVCAAGDVDLHQTVIKMLDWRPSKISH